MSEYRDAQRLATECGLVRVPGLDSRGHEVWVNPTTGAKTSISTTLTDGTRAAKNTRAAIRRAAGLTGRGVAAREGARRTRRSLGRLTTGFSLRKASEESEAFHAAHGEGALQPGELLDRLIEEKATVLARLYEKPDRDTEAERLAARCVAIDAEITQLRRGIA